MFKTLTSSLMVIITFILTEAATGETCSKEAEPAAKGPKCPGENFMYLEEAHECIAIINGPVVTFQGAKEICEEYPGGSLLKLKGGITISMLTSHEEITNVTKGNSYWVGLWICGDHCTDFHWIGGENEPAQGVNWSPGHPLPGSAGAGGTRCAIVNGQIQFESVSCGQKNSYICQAPSGAGSSRPQLTAEPHAGPNILIPGHTWNAKCVVLHDTDQAAGETTYFRFRNASGKDVFAWGLGDKEVKLLEHEKEVADERGRCVSRSVTSLTLHVTKAFSGLRFTCCEKTADAADGAAEGGAAPVCAADRRFSVKFPRRRPSLEVTLRTDGRGEAPFNSSLEASCQACVHTGGSLTWTLSSGSKSTRWTISSETGPRYNLSETPPGIVISHVLGKDGTCEHTIESSMELNVSKDLDEAVIRCETSPDLFREITVHIRGRYGVEISSSRHFYAYAYDDFADFNDRQWNIVRGAFFVSVFLVVVVVLAGIAISTVRSMAETRRYYQEGTAVSQRSGQAIAPKDPKRAAAKEVRFNVVSPNSAELLP